MKAIVLTLCCLLMAASAWSQQEKLPAFPGAEGFGKYTTGGRGGKVFIVKNLNDSGVGSLREALEATVPRIIVFEVSGNIELKSTINVRRGNLTIAGQTAPGDGITIKNHPIRIIDSNNIIIRFMRFRLGDVSKIEADSFEARQGSSNLIIDHCSFSWGTDETCSVYTGSFTTIQNSIIAEGINDASYFGKDFPHAYGSIWGGNNVSFYKNLMAHFVIRVPSIATNSNIADLRNNVIYNWHLRATNNGANAKANLIANFYKPGPATNAHSPKTYINQAFFWPTGSDYGKFYLYGNKLDGRPIIDNDQWLGVRLETSALTEEFLEDLKNKDENGNLVPFSVPSDLYSQTLTADAAYEDVLAHAGASLFRDAVDERLIREVKTGTVTFKGSKSGLLGIIDSQNDVGGWPVLKSLPAPKDTDRDGMPDTWELENGLNPNLADNNGYKLSSSYTNIEVYINSLVKHISEFDATTPPSVPQLESPVNAATGMATNSILKWKSAANAQSYQIQVSKTQDFAALVTNMENLTSLQHSVQNLELNTQYFWRVRTKNSNGTSSWSSIWNFKTVTSLPIPEIPKPISPLNGSKDVSNTLLLQWGTVNEAKTYRVQVAKDESFSSILYDIYNLTSPSIEIKNLTSGTPFYWKVLATNDAGSSSFSNPWTFTTKINTTETIPVTGISISPTKASLEISKTLQLGTTLSPSNASNKTVTWTSSDPSIAGVSSTGLVTGIKSGSANITAKSQDGNFTATSQITVSTSVPLGISGFTLVNADTDSDINTISTGTIIDINQIKGINLNIRVNTNPATVGSVSIKLTGPVSESITENVVPYSLFGDNRGNYNGKILPEGNYTLEAIPYSDTDLGGTKGNLLSIGFTIGQKVIAPTAPTLTSPTNNSTGLPTNPKLSWSAVSNAETYAVEVSRNPDFSILVSNSKLLTTNEVSISGLQEDVLYYWRVRATNPAGSSPYSTVWNFRTKKTVPLPAIPTLVSPTNGAKDLSTSITLQWSAVVGAKTYGVQISKESNFASLFLDNAAVTSTSLQVNNLQAGVTYFWRVRASNEGGNSNFSASWTFLTKANSTTIPVTGISLSPSTATLEISRSLQLSPLVLPTNATNKAVTWSSSDPTIATVSATGLVTAVKSGSARISAKTLDGNFTANSQITVPVMNPAGIITGFTLVNADSDLEIGPLTDGALLDINVLQGVNLNFTAKTNPSSVGSVSIQLSGPSNSSITENFAPYTLYGDKDGDYQGSKLGMGDYILEAIPFSEPNLGGTRGTSLKIRFTIGQKVVVPTIPQLSSPADKSTGIATTTKLTWTAVSNADSYGLEVSKNPDFSSLVVNNNSLTSNEFTVSGLQQDTPYYWRVRATNSAGTSPYSTVWTFRTIRPIPIPAVPSLLSPSNGAKDLSVSPRLQWTSVSGAKTYRVQISKESNFAVLSLDNAAVTSNSLQVNGLQDGVTYYWRVSATNESGSSSYSTVWSFQTRLALIPPTAPVLTSPSNNATGLATTLKLTWNAVTTATGYTLEVSKNPDFSTLVIDNKTLTTNEFTVSGLEEDTSYYWRVRASNSAGNSPYSSVRTFRTVKPITIPNIPILLSPSDAAQEISIVPNLEWTLVNGAKTYRVQLSKDSNFGTILLDNASVTVNSLRINDLEEGMTYYWRVSAGNEAGSSGFSSIWSFKTRILLDPPIAPTLESPSDQDTGLATTLKLTWALISEADKYGIEVSTNQDFSSIISSNFALTENEFTVSGLQEETKYFWRVRASNTAGVSGWSPIWSFTTKEKINPPFAPILLGPENESVGLTGNTVFTWTKSEGAEVYGIQISKDASFTLMQFDVSNIQAQSFETNSLDKGVTYYWRVFAANVGGRSEFSEIWKFETLGIPDIPVLESPSNGENDLEVNPKLMWKTAAGADSYRLQVSKSKDFSQNIVDNSNLLETSLTIQNLEEGITYYWRVRATNLAGNSAYSPIWEFTTEKPIKAPTAPILVSPTSGTILTIDNITLEWKPVLDAERYQVQVSKFSNFSQSIVFNSNSITNNTVALESMEPNQVYFWRVMAINIVGTSPYSAVWNFITAPLPSLDSPILKSPANGAVIDTTSIAFVWEAVTEAENYQLEVSSDSTFKTNVKSFSQILDTKFTLDSLEREKIYYWKVTANGKRPSSESAIWKFEIGKDKKLLVAKFSPITIKTYPNPFTDKINLDFSRPIAGEVTITIFDSKGIPVFESEVTDPKESITLEFPQGLPDGIYVIKVQGFGVLESKRVVKH
ncbi:fibronectin type III domain-containing protein [Cognataquiflexum rubidum]|uniref:fibronectin type III domain-containing protein n=1 Tax=Cognataquiflexum rubidum TaxID=2922273 RepID=UPI001F12B74C|nr:fibronectin type III domain-containing protein [Cognataquiflexum rubidum]MCH6236487.1 fibronectin type III domain-containing protein [Cognataquiflexum rubidum]